MAIGATADAYPENTRAACLGTGGMSQQLHGERLAHPIRDFDARWHDLVVRDLAPLAAMSHFDIMRAAVAAAVELMTWLATRGAMTPSLVRRLVNHYGPSLTGMGLISTVDTVHVLVVAPHQEEPDHAP